MDHFEFLKLLHPDSPKYRVHGIYKERGKLPDPLPEWWYKADNGTRPASMHNAFVGTRAQLNHFVKQCTSSGCNVYYSINRSSCRWPVKLKAEQVSHVDYLHLDLDVKHIPPGVDDPADYCRTQMRAARTGLRTLLPPATFVVFSGGGLQLLWRLSETLVDPDPEHIAGYNKGLADLVHGADSVHDISRIFRLPGTLNIVGAEKAARGRVNATAEVWEHNPTHVLRLEDCPHSDVPKQQAGAAIELSAQLPVIQNLLDIIPPEQHGSPRVDRLQLLAELGYIKYCPKTHGDATVENERGERVVVNPDRSRWDFDFVCQALRCGVNHDDIAGFLLNPTDERNVGEHCRAQGDPVRAVARCIENATGLLRKTKKHRHKRGWW